MATNQQFPLHLNPDRVPYVLLECQEVMTQFDLDTGSQINIASLEQVKAWGLLDTMKPNEEPDDDPVILGMVTLELALTDDYVFMFPFAVEEMNVNMLGLNFLEATCAVVDLQNLTLTIRALEPMYDGYMTTPMVTVNVDGRNVEVMVDTACTMDMCGSLSVAQELGLSLRPCNLPVIGHGILVSTSKQLATGLRFVACGKEMQDCRYIVQGEDIYVHSKVLVLGIGFLLGCRLQFNWDGTFEMAFIGGNNAGQGTKD